MASIKRQQWRSGDCSVSKYQRTKGHNFERWVVNALKDAGHTAKRQLQTQGGGQACGSDVAVKSLGLELECKVGARPNVKAALEQAERDSKSRWQVAVCKWDRAEPIVAMRWSEFLRLLEK